MWLLDKLLDLLKLIFPKWKEKREAKQMRQRVVERFGKLSDIQRSVLKSSFDAASEDPGSRIFGWVTTGGGLCVMESELIFLLDEGAVIQMREERLNGRGFHRWYRFKPWLYEYLAQHPEVLKPPSPTTTT